MWCPKQHLYFKKSGKSMKFVANLPPCQILRSTKIPDPVGEGAYSAPPDPLTGFKGTTSKGRGGKGVLWSP